MNDPINYSTLWGTATIDGREYSVARLVEDPCSSVEQAIELEGDRLVDMLIDNYDLKAVDEAALWIGMFWGWHMGPPMRAA